MGRPRKPTRILELTGSFRKHPDRRRARQHEPEPEPDIGDPPACLNEAQRARWIECVNDSASGVLTRADRAIVETVARLRQEQRDGTITGSKLSIMVTCLRQLGQTPADRSKISVPRPKTSAVNSFGKIG